MSDRINLNISPTARIIIEDIQEKLDLGSISEVVRRAISVLNIITKYQSEGAEIVIKHPSKGEVKIEII